MYHWSQELTLDDAHALCALVWVQSEIELDLYGAKMVPECLAALGRSLRQSLVAINLKETNFANNGGDLSGLRVFCTAIGNPSFCGLKSIDLSDNRLGPDAAKVLAEGLETNRTITSLTCAASSSC